MPTTQQARQWLDRWDRQQEVYIADREERFDVIADVVARVTGRPDPLVVDLGAGPGSLAVRLLERIPGASVVAVDADPLLLGLARAAYGERPACGSSTTTCASPAGCGALGLERPADAVVSTTALHWLTLEQLGGVYRDCAGLIAPGGVLVDGDHLPEDPSRPRLLELTRQVAQAHAQRARGAAGRAGDRGEDWEQWWQAVGSAPELADLRSERGARPLEHAVPSEPTLDDHVRLLLAAGFAEAGPVWQQGDDRVLVGLR